MRSGECGEGSARGGGVGGGVERREVGSQRRRTAWVMVGWKRPPWGECTRRWVGRTWPRVKKVERNLWRLFRIWEVGEEWMGYGLVCEAYVVAA